MSVSPPALFSWLSVLTLLFPVSSLHVPQTLEKSGSPPSDTRNIISNSRLQFLLFQLCSAYSKYINYLEKSKISVIMASIIL